MAEQPQLTYDEALAEAQRIIEALEQAPAISLQEYQQKAKKAKDLLDYCESTLVEFTKEWLVDISFEQSAGFVECKFDTVDELHFLIALVNAILRDNRIRVHLIDLSTNHFGH